MHRLFVALRPSRATRETLLGLAGGVAGARWQDDEQLHLTVAFLGELDRHRAEDVVAALEGVRGAPVPLTIAGTGAFDRRERVHTLWAGVRPDPALAHLHAGVERAVRRAGVTLEARAFHPHVTLARLAVDHVAAAPWLARTAGLRLPTETVGAMILFESMLGRGGARYQAVARFPLGR